MTPTYTLTIVLSIYVLANDGLAKCKKITLLTAYSTDQYNLRQVWTDFKSNNKPLMDHHENTIEARISYSIVLE